MVGTRIPPSSYAYGFRRFCLRCFVFGCFQFSAVSQGDALMTRQDSESGSRTFPNISSRFISIGLFTHHAITSRAVAAIFRHRIDLEFVPAILSVKLFVFDSSESPWGRQLFQTRVEHVHVREYTTTVRVLEFFSRDAGNERLDFVLRNPASRFRVMPFSRSRLGPGLIPSS